jgi:outer membrane protein OmpA-like peptidoglycan-associated protein
MKFRLLLAASCALALPAIAAHAQPVTGPYVSLGVGTSIQNPFNYNYEELSSFSQSYEPGFGTGKFQTRPSYAGVIGAGYGFGNGFRAELSGNYYRNTLHSGSESFENAYSGTRYNYRFPVTGGEDTYGVMANLLYDFNVGLPVFPYVGAGIGYQWVDLSSKIKDSFFDSYIHGTSGSFAYDVIGGLSYPLPQVPGLSLTAEYRFMQLVESHSYEATYQGDPYPDNLGKVKFGQQSSHTFLIGMRYQLFPPPVMAPVVPAPMASPAPAAAKTYLVFFDWDKYSLTPRATQIIAEAASDSKTTATTTINVSGYTDTSGTPTYNQGLSERRAKAVAAKLVMDGVPASEISIHAYGETHLLVPTGPGVREPQNRRVEIVLD